jgi:hypothetical protein
MLEEAVKAMAIQRRCRAILSQAGKTPAEVDTMLEKWKGKEPSLLQWAMSEYPAAVRVVERERSNSMSLSPSPAAV